jgi:mono/diheme cytochrome c family protein
VSNQLFISRISNPRIVIIVMAIALIIYLSILGFSFYQKSDPYIQEVLSLSGNVTQGRAIFEINCAGCHGIDGEGYVGPEITHISQVKSKIGLIEQVISGKTPPMPKFQPNPQEMADLLSYLETMK